jgi:hypothetical protein
MEKIRAKLQVVAVKSTIWGPVEVTLDAQYDNSIPEDQRFQQATPSANFTLLVNNPPAIAALTLGKQFYLDLTAIEPIEQAAQTGAQSAE